MMVLPLAQLQLSGLESVAKLSFRLTLLLFVLGGAWLYSILGYGTICRIVPYAVAYEATVMESQCFVCSRSTRK